MIISNKTLEKLRVLINEETEYRKGPQLVSFFNELGFRDSYGQGFPSRRDYTDEKLSKINGTPELDQCIKNLFNPINFVGNIPQLDKHITEFNEYLAFDGWNVIRKNKEITFAKADVIIPESKNEPEIREDIFINKEFEDIIPPNLLSETISEIISKRIDEIKLCMQAKASLSVVILCGSTLEGILLDVACNNPSQFNQASSAPKDKEGKIKKIHDWTLNNLIDTASELGYLKEDVKKFSHALKDFRNYIHPYQQMVSRFIPDEHTAKICFQVLKAAIFQVSEKNQ